MTKLETPAAAAEAAPENRPLERVSVGSAEVLMVPLAQIQFSKKNPRRNATNGALAELTESIRRHGVLQPVLVRAFEAEETSPDHEKTYELIAGERRCRAAGEAGLNRIPAMILRGFSEHQLLEITIVENLQRSDLHPLEEAEGFRRLHEEHGYTIEELAAKVAKSTRHIYTRLQLCRLPDEVRELFAQGELTAATALLVTQITVPKLQLEAARDMAGRDSHTGKLIPGVGPMTYQQARDDVAKYLTSLRSAGWRLDDEGLVISAGACTTCPKRSGSQAEMFGETSDADDFCLDAECWKAKKNAHVARVSEKAKAQGQEVLTGKEAKQALRGSEVYGKGKLVQLEERLPDQSGRTFKAVLAHKGKKSPPVVTAIDEKSGRSIQLVDREAAHAALALRSPFAKEDQRQKEQMRHKLEQEKREEPIRKEIQLRILRSIKPALVRVPATRFWNAIALYVFEAQSGDPSWGLGLEALGFDEKRCDLIGTTQILAMDPQKARELACNVILAYGMELEFSELTTLLLAELRIDAKAIEADVRAELKKPEAPDAAAAAAKKAPSKKTAKPPTGKARKPSPKKGAR